MCESGTLSRHKYLDTVEKAAETQTRNRLASSLVERLTPYQEKRVRKPYVD